MFKSIEAPSTSRRKWLTGCALGMSLAMSSFTGPISLSANEQTHHHKASTAAQKPPMGWNSFDSYGVYLHEGHPIADLEEQAQQKLSPLGEVW